MTITTFDEARTAVRAGAEPGVVAGELVVSMTPEEHLRCLDGEEDRS